MTVSLGYMLFYVADVAASLDFYTRAFGLEQRFLTPEGDYGELATGATTMGFVSHDLADTNLAASGGFTPLDPDRPPVGAAPTLLVDDVPATVAAAVEAGGRLYREPAVKPWGQTVGYVIDPSGILLEIATPMSTA